MQRKCQRTSSLCISIKAIPTASLGIRREVFFFVPITEQCDNKGTPRFFVALYGVPQQEWRREKEIEMGTKHEFEEIAIGNGLYRREPVSAKVALRKATIEASVVDAKDKTIEFLSLKATARYENCETARRGFMRFIAKVLSDDVIRESGMTLCPSPRNNGFHDGNGFTESENTLETELDLMDVKGIQTNISGQLRPTEEVYAPTKVLRIKAIFE